MSGPHEWRIEDIERMASEAHRRLRELDALRSDVDRMEHTLRETRAVTDGVCRGIEAAQNRIELLEQMLTLLPPPIQENQTPSTRTDDGVRFVRISDALDPEEVAFVEKVMANPGAVLRDWAWSSDGSKSLWTRPEELKLISSVGSYKWIPTTRIVLGFETTNDSNEQTME